MEESKVPEPMLAAHIAEYYLARKRPDDARAALMDTLPTSPAEQRAVANALAKVGRSFISTHRFEDAHEVIETAQSLAETPAVWGAQAALARAHGERQIAQVYWQNAVAKDPENGELWLELARASEHVGDAARAMQAYLRAVEYDHSHATALIVAERLAALAAVGSNRQSDVPVRIALLGSSTLDHVRAYLEIACRQSGLAPEFYVGPYGQYAQQILNPASRLYEFAPDVVILAVHGQVALPDLYNRPFDMDVEERRRAITAAVDHMINLAAQLTARTNALVLMHSFAVPQYSPLGIHDLRDELGQTAIFDAIKLELAARIRDEFHSVYLVDEERVYGRIGKQHVTDPRMFYMARIGIGPIALAQLAREYLRYIKPLKGKIRKCLVLDLDNTLWGGVIGEDGMAGIALGNEAPGNAFVAFQQAILTLWKRGVILAINSKNNQADAMQALESHPDMVLRPSHFAALRINWVDKVANLRSIAEEINIGLDSLVFVDDSPAECALVRAELPEVLTIQLPPDPAHYRETLLSLPEFETLALTTEDRERGRLYAERRQRQAWEATHHIDESRGDSLQGYLSELGLEVDFAPASSFDIPRVAQLLAKTNQFNLTTQRHSESTVRAFCDSPDVRVNRIRVRDRFGDAGLVGVAIVMIRDQGAVWELDSLLLSCRVLGRGVETAVLSAIAAEARANRATTLRGIFIPTAKNESARAFYARHEFTLLAEDNAGKQLWVIDLHSHSIDAPDWLTLRRHADAEEYSDATAIAMTEQSQLQLER